MNRGNPILNGLSGSAVVPTASVGVSPAQFFSRNWDIANLALGKPGLELVSTNMPIEMLVVEKAE
ncbi:MAG: hypothetical protein ABSG04_06520 [Verrucomicrobiota bacterium]